MHAGAFGCGNDFESYRFVPFGIEGHKSEANIFFTWAYDTIVASPFLTDSIVSKIAENSGTKKLITRVTAASKKAFDVFDEVWIPKEEILNNEVLEEGNNKGDFRDLHAKIIYRTTKDGNFLYLGSLNATENAFFKNIEFMLELKYKAYHGGYSTVHDDLLPKDSNVFRKLDAPIDVESEETDEMLSDFSDVVRAVELAHVVEKDGTYQVVIKSRCLDNKTEIAPLMKSSAFKELEEETVFDGLHIHELSCLYIARRGNQNRIIKIPTKGIPDERNDILFNRILRDNQGKVGFFTYLLFLLSGGQSESLFHQEDMRCLMLNGNSDRKTQELVPSLYEQLVRAAAESTDTIQNISDVVNKVEPDMIDDSLKELIELIKTSVRKRR